LLAAGAWLLVGAAQAAPPEDPSFRITLDRGACFGSCPVYSVEVGADGQVIFRGARSRAGTSVACLGERRWRVSADDVAKLEAQVDGIGFFQYRDAYMGPPDLPAYTVTVTRHGQTKTVRERAGELAGAPEALTTLQLMIDDAAGTVPCIDGPRHAP
jgi:hypothetical protein